jgi:hypothetical protein
MQRPRSRHAAGQQQQAAARAHRRRRRAGAAPAAATTRRRRAVPGVVRRSQITVTEWSVYYSRTCSVFE